MRYQWRDLPALCRTPVGRTQIRKGVLRRTWPVLSQAAALYRRTRGRHTRLAAVVGSFGKTTTTRTLRTVFGLDVATQKSGNAYETLARHVFQIQPDDPYMALEVGISDFGQMADYARVLRPDIAVVTSIGKAHQKALRTLENTRHEKAEMVRALSASGLAVLNGDDPNVLWMKSQTRASVITYGLKPENDVSASDYRMMGLEGARFCLHLDGQTHNLHVRLLGQHMVYPILAAIAAAHGEGLPLTQTLSKLEHLAPSMGRLEPVPLPDDILLLRDDHKGSLISIHAALEVLAQLPAKRRIAVLHEPSDTIDPPELVYPPLGAHLARIVTHLLFMGESTCLDHLAAGMKDTGLTPPSCIHIQGDVLDAIQTLHQIISPGDVILLKGPHQTRLLRITLSLLKRSVRCRATYCDARMECPRCPMLEKGWGERRIVI